MPTQKPPGRSLAAALGDSEALAGLLQRVQESRARLAAVAGLLPPGMQADVRAGPLDDSAWVLLAGHAAAAAKLRQLLPAMEAALAEAGFAPRPLKVRVRPRDAAA